MAWDTLLQNKFTVVGLIGNFKFSAQTVCMRDGWAEVKGPEGTQHLVDNSERVLSLYAANGLRAGGSLFCRKNICKWTWHISPAQNHDKSEGCTEPISQCVGLFGRCVGRASMQLRGNTVSDCLVLQVTDSLYQQRVASQTTTFFTLGFCLIDLFPQRLHQVRPGPTQVLASGHFAEIMYGTV